MSSRGNVPSGMFRPVCLTQIQFLPPPDTVSVTPFPPVVLELREAPDWLDPATHVEPDPELRGAEKQRPLVGIWTFTFSNQTTSDEARVK